MTRFTELAGFLACPEAGTHPDYRASLLTATGDDTVLTGWFNEGWPDAPHRVLRAALDAAQRSGWRAVKPPTRDDTRPAADMAQYAGTGVGAVRTSESAHDVLRYLVSGLAQAPASRDRRHPDAARNRRAQD